MKIHFGQAARVAVLSVCAVLTGCRTYNSVKNGIEDVCPRIVDGRLLSYTEALVPEEREQAEVYADYVKGLYLLGLEPAETETAQKHFQRAMMRRPEVTQFAVYMLQDALKKRDYAGALALLEPVVKANPASEDCNLLYSQILSWQNKPEESFEHLLNSWKAGGYQEQKLYSMVLEGYCVRGRFCDAYESLLKFQRLGGYDKACKEGRKLVVTAQASRFWDVWSQKLELLEQVRQGRQSMPQKDFDVFQKNVLGRYTPLQCNAYRDKEVATLVDAYLEGLNQKDCETTQLMKSLNLVCDTLIILKKNLEIQSVLEKTEAKPGLAENADFIFAKMNFLEKSGEKAVLSKYLDSLLARKTLPVAILRKVADNMVTLKRHRVAIFLYQQLLLARPQDNQLRECLANLYLATGQTEQGLKLLACIPEPRGFVYFLKACLYRQKGEMQLAYDAMKQAAERAPREHSAYIGVAFYQSFAMICEQLEKVDEALEFARKAYELEKDDPSTCNFYAYLLADHDRDLKKAEELLVKVIEKVPDNAAYLDSMAWLYYRQKKYAEAMKYILKAMTVGGLEQNSDGVIAEHAGDICKAAGYPELARHYWRMAAATTGSAAKSAQQKLKNNP